MRAAMQSSETRTVVPATAVRVIDILGGTPIEQAIPEDYTLAAVVLDALESRNNGELQFVLKCYLPVRMTVLGRSGRVALMERMGLVLATVEIPESRDLDSVAERASSVTDIDAGLSLIDDAAMLLDEIARFEVITVPGLLSSGAAAAVSRLTRWPSRDAEEPYAIVLPEVIESNTTEKALSRIAFWAEHLHISLRRQRQMCIRDRPCRSRSRNIRLGCTMPYVGLNNGPRSSGRRLRACRFLV